MNHMVDREFISFCFNRNSLSIESLVTLKIKMAPFFEKKNDEIFFFGRYAQVDVTI